MLYLLDADLLTLVSPIPATICKLTAVSKYFLKTLAKEVEGNKVHAERRVTWKGKKLIVHLRINAPHTVRIVWHSFGTTKEMRLQMKPPHSFGQTIDGSTNFSIGGLDVTSLTYRRGSIKFYSLFRQSAVVYLTPGTVKIHLTVNEDRRLPNGKLYLSIPFHVPTDLYYKFLTLVDNKEKKRQYTDPSGHIEEID